MIVGCNALECKYINSETLTCSKDKIVISATIDSDNNVITECDDFEKLLDAVRPKGKWLLLDECSNEGVYCSNCHKKVYRKDYANQKVKSNFCPNCGADMSGDYYRM